MNRISNTQSNVAFYKPLFLQNKTGHEPPFSLDKTNPIVVQSEKNINENMNIH
jgi:hypothetical protein